ncbi:hypothetical protein [Pseudophaeobacter arcticus]|jgi:hypothetical protein|uniref:hypothetical protein n=1 Tax=Pseudophaeobacter arcticus TaxID=385492 RepID=UPI003A97FB74
MIQPLVQRLFVTLAIAALATSARSDDPTDFSSLADRYTIYDGQKSGLRHWGRAIRPELVGEVPSDLALYGVSLIQVLSMLADEEVEMVGEADTWFAAKSAIDRQSNFVIAFEELQLGQVEPTFRFKATDLAVDANDASSEVIGILDSGLLPVGPGCFGQWFEHKENVVSAVALVVDLGAEKLARRACLEFGVISALGVFPESTPYGSAGIGRSLAPEPFYDTSEVFFLTQLSAYCRNALMDSSVDCARKMIDRVYGGRTGSSSN